MNRSFNVLLAALAGLLSLASVAQTAQPAAAASPAKTKNYVLVSAVGDQFTYVRQKQQVGSNIIDNFDRKVFKVPNNILNTVVLRGLDRAVSAEDPDSKRTFLTLAPAELEGVRPQDRERIAIGKLAAILEKMPERATWDKIYIVTPKFLLSEYSGMGAKLQGLGVYVQPLEGGKIDDVESGVSIDGSSFGESEVLTPEGEGTRTKVYVAPFSYLSLYVLDPKTMNVIEKNTRHDFRKLFDPKSTALDVSASISLEFLAENIDSLVERSVMKAVKDVEDKARIDIGEVRPSKDKAPETKPDGKK